MIETSVDPSPLSFSVATPIQQDTIEGVLRSAFEPYVRKLGRRLTADAYAWLGPALRDGRVYVALDQDIVVAVAVTDCQGQELAIDQIAVLPQRQGAGIGSWLLAKIDGLARGKGLKSVSLYTAAMMDDLLRLYHRHGFREVRRRLPTHGKDAHLRVYLRKDLT